MIASACIAPLPLASPLAQAPVGAAGSRLEQATTRLPVVCTTLAAHGDLTLGEYVRRVVQFAPRGCQPRDDLLEVVRAQSARLLGDEVAARTVADLARMPVVLSANHHGVDFFAQSMQSNLAFALRTGADGWAPTTVPIFACGAVPLNNLTYPRGLLLYGAAENGQACAPLKVPVFPDRMKRDLVNVARGVDADMLDRAAKRLRGLIQSGKASAAISAAAEAVVLEDYGTASTLALDRYADQATGINHRIWRRLHRTPASAPDLVYLELEHIAARLLERDVFDRTSLAWPILFDAGIRSHLAAALDGARACWDSAAIEARLEATTGDEAAAHGTVFFWAITEAGRRVPLALVDGTEHPELAGVDDRGNPHVVPLTPQAISEGLQAGRLLPSVFSCYLVIALARGVTCVGGYYQAEYLPTMQNAVLAALQAGAAPGALTSAVAAVPTSAYLSGMQMVMQEAATDALLPAGPIEMIAAGGLTHDHLTAVARLTVREAHLASVIDTVLDCVPREAREAGWERAVSQDLHRLLANRIVFT